MFHHVMFQDELQSVGFHPNGNILAVATKNNKFLVLDADSGEAEFFNCEIGSEQHDCIKYSPGKNFWDAQRAMDNSSVWLNFY